MRYYSNTAAAAVLTSDAASGATALTLDTVSGFPSSFPFSLVIDPGTISSEVVSVTAVVGTTVTVTRGQDSTTAVSHSAGAAVVHSHSARDFKDSRDHEAATSAHGVVGAVVGTTDSQTLTNKNLTAGTNSFPTSLATLTGAQALTNKDLSSATNTLPAAVVTLTGAQSLTNKNLTDSTNTFPDSAKRPAGEITMFGGAAAPSGWLLCDGSSVLRATYPALFTAIGTTFGSVDGTHFTLPDLRSRAPMGAGTLGALGANEGAAEASRTPNHVHTISTETLTLQTNTTATGGADRLTGPVNHNHGGATGSTSNPFPRLSVNFIIKT